MDRRTFLADFGGLTTLLFLAAGPAGAQAFTGSAARKFADLMARSDELTGLFRGEALTDREWRAGLDGLVRKLPLEDLLRAIDFESLRQTAGYADRGVSTSRLKLPDGTVRTVNFFPKIFAVGTGRAIMPHGHTNMVSAHLILNDSFHLRQYDQLQRSATSMRVRPSIDRLIGAGELSSIGESTDNVHWFIAQTPSHTLDFIVTGLDPETDPDYDVINLDMESARRESSGDLVVPILDVETALKKYG